LLGLFGEASLRCAVAPCQGLGNELVAPERKTRARTGTVLETERLGGRRGLDSVRLGFGYHG
jgi:hypothetical protein